MTRAETISTFCTKQIIKVRRPCLKSGKLVSKNAPDPFRRASVRREVEKCVYRFFFGVRKKNGDLSYSYNRMCVVSVPIKLRKIDIDYCQWRVDFHARCGQWFVLWIIFLVCKNVRFRNGYTLPRTRYYILLLNYYVCNIVMILCERKFLVFFCVIFIIHKST